MLRLKRMYMNALEHVAPAEDDTESDMFRLIQTNEFVVTNQTLTENSVPITEHNRPKKRLH